MDSRTWKARGLEVQEDSRFHRLNVRAQQIGWEVIGLLLLASLLGAFGAGGPLDRGRSGSRELGLEVEYERFPRYSASSKLRLRFGERAAHAGELRVLVDRRYLAGVRIDAIVPAPIAVESAPGQLLYRFAAGDEPPEITFHVHVDTIGPQRVRLALAGGPAVSFTQFVYP